MSLLALTVAISSDIVRQKCERERDRKREREGEKKREKGARERGERARGREGESESGEKGEVVRNIDIIEKDRDTNRSASIQTESLNTALRYLEKATSVVGTLTNNN